MSIRPRPMVAHDGDDRKRETRPSILETINGYFFGKIALQDRMGPPGVLNRDHEYAVVAGRNEIVVAITFATLEGAEDCARLGARTRRFVVEIDHPNGSWYELSHLGEDTGGDNRIRAWLRKELDKLKEKE